MLKGPPQGRSKERVRTPGEKGGSRSLGLLALLMLALVPARAVAPEPPESRTGLAVPAPETCKLETITWLDPLPGLWRREYLEGRLTPYLFRNVAGAGQGAAQAGDESRAIPVEMPYPEQDKEGGRTPEASWAPSVTGSEKSWQEVCARAERYLASGLLPEALAELEFAERLVETSSPLPARIAMGKLEVRLAAGRTEEARALFRRLPPVADGDEELPSGLLEAILAGLERDYGRSAELFLRHGTDWSRCGSVEPFAGYSLLVSNRAKEAGSVFQVAAVSGWAAVRSFGILGGADSSLELGRCADAASGYERLMQAGDPMGFLAMAELHLRQDDAASALGALERLLAATDDDYWKGAAYGYLMTVKRRGGDWAESLRVAGRCGALALRDAWRRHVEAEIRQALEQGVQDLAGKGEYREILFLAGQWKDACRALSRQTQLLLVRACQEQRLPQPALDIYAQVAAGPEDLLLAARFAWESERYDEARAFLDKLRTADRALYESGGRLLESCVLFGLDPGRVPPEGLAAPRDDADAFLLLGLGDVEASLGMTARGTEDLLAGLKGEAIPAAERNRALRQVALLLYEQGRLEEALKYFREARAAETPAGGPNAAGPEPAEVLCLLRAGNIEEARQRLAQLERGEDSVFLREIVAAHDLIQLHRGGHARDR
ncbi:MAG: tetratricopeptide repeat protein [bacterium]